MAIIQLPVDEQKVLAFRNWEKQLVEIQGRRSEAEAAMNDAKDAYHNAKAGAQRGMIQWADLGPLHVDVMKKTYDYEKLQQEEARVAAEVQAAKPVMIDEVLRAARALIK